jgi:high-affinity K+ transport system ATPase subunit B
MGIAMAITGSEVSREAASIVLLDDNFTSVVEGIKRGRTIFASMKKVLHCSRSYHGCYCDCCYYYNIASCASTIVTKCLEYAQRCQLSMSLLP